MSSNSSTRYRHHHQRSPASHAISDNHSFDMLAENAMIVDHHSNHGHHGDHERAYHEDEDARVQAWLAHETDRYTANANTNTTTSSSGGDKRDGGNEGEWRQEGETRYRRIVVRELKRPEVREYAGQRRSESSVLIHAQQRLMVMPSIAHTDGETLERGNDRDGEVEVEGGGGRRDSFRGQLPRSMREMMAIYGDNWKVLELDTAERRKRVEQSIVGVERPKSVLEQLQLRLPQLLESGDSKVRML